MRLGQSSLALSRRKAPKRAIVAPPARAVVRDAGVELEVVWYPHRDALPLLSLEYPAIDARQMDAGVPDLRWRLRHLRLDGGGS